MDFDTSVFSFLHIVILVIGILIGWVAAYILKKTKV
jgi:uncharacterized membrane protein YeaQ/YmgE (transglycosylase-associated protein family)